MAIVRVLMQLALECIRTIIASKEFRDFVFDMISKAVFGVLNLIKNVSLFLYNKTLEVGGLIASKINSLIKRIKR